MHIAHRYNYYFDPYGNNYTAMSEPCNAGGSKVNTWPMYVHMCINKIEIQIKEYDFQLNLSPDHSTQLYMMIAYQTNYSDG